MALKSEGKYAKTSILLNLYGVSLNKEALENIGNVTMPARRFNTINYADDLVVCCIKSSKLEENSIWK